MELLLVRHALPARSNEGEGADPPLSALGRLQAEVLAEWLSGAHFGGPPGEVINAVYSSPMERAHETALLITEKLGCPLFLREGLAEYDALGSQYIPVEELRASGDPRWQDIVSGEAIPNEEIFQAQVVDTVEALIAAHPGQRLLLACHGGVIGAYLAHVLGIRKQLFFEAGYTSISRVLAASTGQRSVASMNELAHLRVARVPLYVEGG